LLLLHGLIVVPYISSDDDYSLLVGYYIIFDGWKDEQNKKAILKKQEGGLFLAPRRRHVCACVFSLDQVVVVV
jgi:hypothetical protein